MQTIKASDFKARCLALMDEVARTGEPVVVTKNGKPVAELRPYTGDRPASPFGLHRGQIRILGDIMEPMDVDEWEAQRRMSSGGRVVIPAKLRKAIGLRPGDALIIRLMEEGLVITTPERAVRAAQALVREYVPPDRKLGDELLAERRHEAIEE